MFPFKCLWCSITKLYAKCNFATLQLFSYNLYFYAITNWLQLVTVTSNSDLDACKCISLIMWCCFLWGFLYMVCNVASKVGHITTRNIDLGFFWLLPRYTKNCYLFTIMYGIWTQYDFVLQYTLTKAEFISSMVFFMLN